MKTLKIAMFGFGNAGKAFAKLLISKQEEIRTSLDFDIKIAAIVTLTRGNLVDAHGIDLQKAIKDIELEGHFNKSSMAYSEYNSEEILQNADYDVLMEITPLNILSGEPAIHNITTAFNRKKHVITANKGPIAWAYKELKALSIQQGVVFLHETAVMDGTPIFNLVEDTLPMCKIKGLKGILNTTTNFVLEEMSKGYSFEEAIAEGESRGFVEADASMDIDGFDAAAKTAALINVLMEGNVTPLDIMREGIQHITHVDIGKAEEDGKVIKLICEARLQDGVIIGEVKPVEIGKDNIFASIKGTSSVLSISTDLMGEVTIVEHDPEIVQTGYGLFSDLLRLIKFTEDKK
jgi:homoserine dehydrogenase